ncbi:PPPDE putative peptidase domain-containing protein [Multifurca ochricompacta]|uniref:PPPDE putative peptidase domain-containing protein n=1 Tax=Multifurca ochricompacta TaxID=376703 RepID=A0AAD4M7I8_9AGAM|nr:PPPDE putative peptidase domain-containing protein [Multifurca ochricompacta]
MPFPVKLYVYDLSNGLARAMSMQLTGRQIDGIWHTSVVAFNKEILYGQGILITAPGQSHHGQPLQIIDMGETAIDEQIFEEYLAEMRVYYTADKSDDCVGFLTGRSIPSWIKDLPSDFLSTPFGAALRPTIDSMFRRPTGVSPAATPPIGLGQQTNPALTAPLLQAVANRAAGTTAAIPRATTSASLALDSGYSSPSSSTTAGPIHASTDPASFRSLLGSHRAVVVMFTSATCGPCKMIEPVFEELAQAKSRGKGQGQVAFTKVDLAVDMSGMIARQYNVSATPTFGFFLDGKRIHELKGVNAPELRTQVDLLLYQAFPPHPHTSLNLPFISSVSTEPILFAQVPALDTVRDKLVSFIDSSPSLNDSNKIKEDLAQKIFPWLKQRYVEKSKVAPSPVVVNAFGQTITMLVAELPAASMFPLLDIWRLAILEPTIAQVTLTPLVKVLTLTNESVTSSPRATFLPALTGVLVQTLLHPDRLVRVAAASLAFNVGAWLQKGRLARVRGDNVDDGIREGEEDGEWEVELVSAVAEALANEEESEDAVHRLTATLAFLIRLSPFFQDQLHTLLNVLQVRRTLKSKLTEDGKLNVRKKEVRALVGEVADQLCKP